MRYGIFFLAALALLMLAPAVAHAQTPGYARPATLPYASVALAADNDPEESAFYTAGMDQLLWGTAVVGGAFIIGLLAGGSLSSAFGAVGAVAISYALLP
ncbi:hypothetical protein ABLE91_18110 [Aquabacter sp. CN5-332]|uniref:hypothetical protein n=1 Tax=Aquabacter sp. CN5-332 TaxID=3156608 RepID=UPI0032B42902